MQFTYDGQIRRYIVQTIRFFSNFCVKYGDGTLVRVPVMYGDQDRQVANIIKQNSDNVVNSCPRIAVYVTDLSLDRERLADATYTGKMHFRERDVDPDTGFYNQNQGRHYTVERLMPTPFTLTMKVDFWSSSTDQKLQMFEQILHFFNPSVELQTSDNYIDWTSLSVLNLDGISWSSRSLQGTDTAIDVSSITVKTPIWISPPAKVKHLGVITNIITSLYQGAEGSPTGYIDGLGIDLTESTEVLSNILTQESTTIDGFSIQVYNGVALLLNPGESAVEEYSTSGIEIDVPVRQGTPINWIEVFNKYPGKYIAGSSRIYLLQKDGSEIVGTIAVDPMDDTQLSVMWDSDTLLANTILTSDYRPASPGTFDAIIDPTKYNPKRPTGTELTDQGFPLGLRFLIIEDIGNIKNQDGPDAWKSTSGVDFYAKANDIIEWDGAQWNVIFDAVQGSEMMVWLTNTYTGVQYLWNGVSWGKSFEGIYKVGQWRIVL